MGFPAYRVYFICLLHEVDPEEVVVLDESKKFQVNFTQEANKINSVSWEDIDEAIEYDRKLKVIRNALKMNDEETIQTEISGLKISDNWADPSEIVKTSSGLKIEDLSLYRNCLLIRNRIWVPEDLRQNFYNNLHLGHRGVDIMMRLALRSAYWVNMKADLQYFLNDCSTCLAQQEKNKKLPKIPEVKVREPFEQLTMDIGKTPAGEHILAITDRFTGYVWASKTGDRGTGTSAKCIDILKSHVGTGLLTTSTIKSDEGSQLISVEMHDFVEERGIKTIKSSAYNPAGNLLAENGIRRVKRAIGREKMEDGWDHIPAF